MVVLVLGVLAIVGQSALARDTTPSDCSTTTQEENAALITQLIETVDAGEDVAPFFAKEHVSHTSTGVDMPNNGPQWFSDRQADFPDLTVTSDLLVAQDSLVVGYLTWSGTQQVADELLGVPATGQHAEWTSIAIFRLGLRQDRRDLTDLR
jgi:predicted ester cyclase